MRKIHSFIVVLLVAMVASCASCGDKDGDSNTSDTAVELEITSCSPAAGATDVKPGEQDVISNSTAVSEVLLSPSLNWR